MRDLYRLNGDPAKAICGDGQFFSFHRFRKAHKFGIETSKSVGLPGCLAHSTDYMRRIVAAAPSA
jgi:hypothetical protein